MTQSIFKRSTAFAALALALHVAPALSARVSGTVTSGTVTAINGYDITVNGQTYSVQTTGDALSQLQQVQPGQQVDLVLSGPPGATTTQVVAIHVHTAS